MRSRTVAAGVALALAVAGVALLLRAGSGLTAHDTIVEGVPLTEVRARAAATGSGGAPGVVVAHGFAGSARLMRPFGDTLARRGFVVVLLDFAGHGRNTSGLGGKELDIAVRHLRSLSGVDGSRISLVGHSMGAGVVTRYAASHPDIAATVAISLGTLDDAPPRMLLLVGGLEFPRFREVAAAAAAESRERRVVTVPFVEHISVLYAPLTHEEILRWLDAPPGTDPAPWLRLLGGALLLVAFALGLHPLTALLRASPEAPTPAEAPTPLETPTPPEAPAPSLTPFAVAATVAVAAAVAAIGVAAALPTLTVGGYVGVFAASAGAAMLLWTRLRGQPPRLGGFPSASPILIAYPMISVAVPIHFGLTHALPTGPRWLLLPAMIGAFVLLGLGTIGLTGGRFWPTATVLACATMVLSGAALAGVAPGFITLVVPLLVLLLGWQAIWTALLTRAGAPAWLAAPAGAILPAWPTATAMPL